MRFTCTFCGTSYDAEVADYFHASRQCEAPPAPPPADPVNHPAHYISEAGIESIDVIEAFGLGFCLGNTVKYVLRCGRKDPAKSVEDLKKARWYLDREIARRESGK